MISTLIWLAVLPSALLIYRVLKSDKVESEPPRLIIRVFLLGAASCFPAALLETFGETLVTNIVSTQAMYSALMFLFVVPAAEEFVKFLAMCSIRKRPEFNYTFDGIVYGVAASLGFATLENLFYVLGEGSYTVAIMRGVLSVPLHCTCGVFMGYYYGLTQWYRAHGQKSEASKSQTLTLLVPIIIHGLYDYSLDVDNAAVTIAGLVFTVVMLVLAVRRVRLSSSQDTPFGGVPIHQEQVIFPQGAVVADRPFQKSSDPAARPYPDNKGQSSKSLY